MQLEKSTDTASPKKFGRDIINNLNVVTNAISGPRKFYRLSQ